MVFVVSIKLTQICSDETKRVALVYLTEIYGARKVNCEKNFQDYLEKFLLSRGNYLALGLICYVEIIERSRDNFLAITVYLGIFFLSRDCYHEITRLKISRDKLLSRDKKIVPR